MEALKVNEKKNDEIVFIPPHYIVFEGVDGVGKTTIVEKIRKAVYKAKGSSPYSNGCFFRFIREPDDLLSSLPPHDRKVVQEMMESEFTTGSALQYARKKVYFLDADKYKEVALKYYNCFHVVFDRSFVSTMAYNILTEENLSRLNVFSATVRTDFYEKEFKWLLMENVIDYLAKNNVLFPPPRETTVFIINMTGDEAIYSRVEREAKRNYLDINQLIKINENYLLAAEVLRERMYHVVVVNTQEELARIEKAIIEDFTFKAQV